MEKMLDFLQKAGRLKKIKRSGWVLRKVPNPESVAEHSFRTAILACVLADEFNVNKEKFIKMALIHDLPECIVGDITPHEKITEKEKFKLEKKAMEKICSLIKNGNALMNLRLEFEEKKSKEAKLTNELDKLEILIQAFEYEQEHAGIGLNLDDFWEHDKESVLS